MSKLKDYCLNITDGEHGTISEDINGTYYLLNNNNITDRGIVINSGDRKISFSDYKKIHKRTKLEKGDVVIATCGTLGKTQVITDEQPNYEFSRSVGIYKCDKTKLLPYFLHYAFMNPIAQKKIINVSKGAVQKHFYIDDMAEFEIDIPSLEKQMQIVTLLKAIDAKISNNNRINAELESMAKTIYDYWFTQFDFPDENGKPYKSSGGKMVWNKELKREIPEGWGATTIGSILGDYPKTTSILRDDYGLGSKYPIVDQSKDYICGYTDDYDNVLHMNDAIVYGDHTNYTKYVNFDFARGADGTQIINSNEQALPNYILYQQILLLPVIEKGYSRHFKFLKEQYVVVPEFKVSQKYMDIVKCSLLKAKSIIAENQQLASLRDWLLPMLMNGQVGFEGIIDIAQNGNN